MLSDRPNLKAGGTDAFAAPRYWPQWYPGTAPFTAANLVRAFRHGGAIPWSMVREQLPAGTLPDPTGTAYYVTEVPGVDDEFSGLDPYPAQFAHDAWGWTTNAPPPGADPPPYNFNPKGALSAFLQATAADRAKMMVRPARPVLSAEDPLGLFYSGAASPWPVDGLFHGPAPLAVIGLMRRMQLVKAAASSLVSKTLGAQAQYFSRVYGGARSTPGMPGEQWFRATFSGSQWVVPTPPAPVTPYCWTFAEMWGGWLYNPQITPETGCVSDALSMAEGAPFDVIGNACFVKGDPVTHKAKATCVTWPLGIRKVLGNAYAPPGAATFSPPPRLVWHDAGEWRCWLRMIGQGYVGWWGNATLDPFYDTFGPIFDGYEYPRPYLFRGYSHEMENGARNLTGGWQTLATFNSWDGTNLGEGTLSSTLPAPGQEIIITGYHPYMHSFGPEEAADMHATFFPEPSVARIAIPLLHGGVLQGGSP